LAVLIRAAHERSRKIYGSPRVHAKLQAQVIAISRKHAARRCASRACELG